jgi:hypothetical protein
MLIMMTWHFNANVIKMIRKWTWLGNCHMITRWLSYNDMDNEDMIIGILMQL